MARQRRQTLPLDTVHGTLTDYAAIERHLVDGEMKGRAWLFAQALAGEELSSSLLIEPFPSEADEDDDGLAEADGHRPDRLRKYYVARFVAAFDPAQTLSSD